MKIEIIIILWFQESDDAVSEHSEEAEQSEQDNTTKLINEN